MCLCVCLYVWIQEAVGICEPVDMRMLACIFECDYTVLMCVFVKVNTCANILRYPFVECEAIKCEATARRHNLNVV